MLQYTQDYDERFVPISSDGSVASATNTANAWTVATLPYSKNRAILLCPSNSSNKWPALSGQTNAVNYSYNVEFGRQGTSPDCHNGRAPAARSHAQIALPSQTPLLVECVGVPYPAASDNINQAIIFNSVGDAPFPFYGAILRDPANPSSGWAMDTPTYLGAASTANGANLGHPIGVAHFEAANILFGDGHVKAVKSPNPSVPSPVTYNLDYCPDGIVGTTTTAH